MAYFNPLSSSGIRSPGPVTQPGTNPPTPTSITQANAMPDKNRIAQLEGAQGKKLYPPVNKADPKFMMAYKGLFAFLLRDPNKTRFEPVSRRYSMERDMVYYLQYLNGIVPAAKSAALHQLFAEITVLGTVDQDLKGGAGKEAGSPEMNNILLAGGKFEAFNTGYEVIHAGSLFMVMPPAVHGGEVLTGGAALIPQLPEGLAPLVTVPYREGDAKASRPMMLSAFKGSQVNFPKTYSDYGGMRAQELEHHMKNWIDGAKMIGLCFAKLLLEDNALNGMTEWNKDNAQEILKHVNQGGADTGAFTKKFADMLLDPEGDHYFFPRSPPRPDDIQSHRRDVLRGKRSRTGNVGDVETSHTVPSSFQSIGSRIDDGSDGFERMLNLQQHNGFDKIFASSVQSEFTRRSKIAGKALTAAGPGNGFDYIPILGGFGTH